MECVCRQNYICICNNIHMTLLQCVRRGIYIFTYKKRWMKIHKSMCTYTKLQVEKLLIYIPITLLWKCTPDSTTKLHSKLHTKTPFQTPHQSYTPDSTTNSTPSYTTKLHSILHAKSPHQTLWLNYSPAPHQNSTPDFTQKLHSRLYTKTSCKNSTPDSTPKLHSLNCMVMPISRFVVLGSISKHRDDY
jgi:hypothetical protein